MRRSVIIATSVLAATGGFWVAGSATSAAPPEKVTICHGTASETNPYVQITVSSKSFKDGHFDDGPNNKSHGENNHPDFVLEEGRTCADGPGGGTTTTTSTTTDGGE